jgi:hypothetical protein
VNFQPRHAVGSEGTLLALARSGSTGSVGRTRGNICGAAGVRDNRINGCGSRSGIGDSVDGPASVAGGLASGVQFSVKRLAGGRKTRSTGSIAKGLRDDVVSVVLVTAEHALACVRAWVASFP